MTGQLDLFRETLPHRPYCTDDLSLGLVIRPRLAAIERRYIQHNPPTRKHWIVVDVDRPGGGHDWEFLEAPAPNLVAENRENLHAHLFYGLALPVHTDPEAHVKPLRYAAAVEHALVKKLGGDYGYAGLVAKNPLCDYWEVHTYQENLYDLAWLSDYVDLEPYADRRRRLPDYGLGRNCTLFERLRLWSYRAILKAFWPTFDAWRTGVFLRASEYNDFPTPLPLAEVRATAKSVAKWTWAHFSAAGFSAIQAARARRLNEIKRERAAAKRQLVLELLDENPKQSVRDLSARTGIPFETVRRLLVDK